MARPAYGERGRMEGAGTRRCGGMETHNKGVNVV
jgi:hypothetical protein